MGRKPLTHMHGNARVKHGSLIHTPLVYSTVLHSAHGHKLTLTTANTILTGHPLSVAVLLRLSVAVKRLPRLPGLQLGPTRRRSRLQRVQ